MMEASPAPAFKVAQTEFFKQVFGPASPDKLAAPYGLKSFVDRTCPFHPCVQWTCRNQANWCMRKISAIEVGNYLESILADRQNNA